MNHRVYDSDEDRPSARRFTRSWSDRNLLIFGRFEKQTAQDFTPDLQRAWVSGEHTLGSLVGNGEDRRKTIPKEAPGSVNVKGTTEHIRTWFDGSFFERITERQFFLQIEKFNFFGLGNLTPGDLVLIERTSGRNRITGPVVLSMHHISKKDLCVCATNSNSRLTTGKMESDTKWHWTISESMDMDIVWWLWFFHETCAWHPLWQGG